MRYVWFMSLLLVASCDSDGNGTTVCQSEETLASVRIMEDPLGPTSVLLKINRAAGSRKLLDAYAVFSTPDQSEVKLLLNTWDMKNEPCFVQRILTVDEHAVSSFRIELLTSGINGEDGEYLTLPLEQLLENSRGTFSSEDF